VNAAVSEHIPPRSPLFEGSECRFTPLHQYFDAAQQDAIRLGSMHIVQSDHEASVCRGGFLVPFEIG